MGFIVAAAIVVAGILSTAAAVIATAVVAIVATVVAAVATIAAVVSTIVATVSAAIVSAVSAVYSAVASVVLPIFSQISSVAQVIYNGLSAYVSALSAGFKAFAQAIHLKTLLELHKLGMILSEDYRRMIYRLYGRMSEVGQALRLPAEFLNLAFRNARAVVLSVSGLMGKNYDLAEITWLNSWNKGMKALATDINYFTNNPTAIYDVMDNYLMKDVIDAEAGTMLTVYTAIEDTILSVQTAAEQVIDVRQKVGNLIEDLPEFMSDAVTEKVGPLIEKFDNFQSQVYGPNMELIDRILTEIGSTLEASKSEIEGLVDNLKRPGDMFENIRFLDLEQRVEQEDKIRSTVFGGVKEDTGDFKGVYLPHSAELKKLADALALETVSPEWKVPEEEAPARPADKPVEPRKTWEVGDF